MTSNPSSPPPPQPLGYQSAAPEKRRPIIDLPLGIICGFAASLISVMLLVVVPYVWAMQAPTLMNFGVRIPDATRSLLAFSRFCQSGGIALIWILFAIPPIVAARMQPWPPPPIARQRIFRPARIIITLMVGLFCVWIVLGLMLPHTVLLDAISAGSKKQG